MYAKYFVSSYIVEGHIIYTGGGGGGIEGGERDLIIHFTV